MVFPLHDPVKAVTGGMGRRRGIAPFGLFWLVFVGFWTSGSVTAHAPLTFTLMSLPFWAVGIGMIAWVLSGILGRLKIEIGPAGLVYTRRRLFFHGAGRFPLRDVGESRLAAERGIQPGRYRTWSYSYGYGYRRGGHRQEAGSTRRLSIDLGADTLSFGGGLSAREQEWLRDAINVELQKAGVHRPSWCTVALTGACVPAIMQETRENREMVPWFDGVFWGVLLILVGVWFFVRHSYTRAHPGRSVSSLRCFSSTSASASSCGGRRS